jgi:hypothetical protein
MFLGPVAEEVERGRDYGQVYKIKFEDTALMRAPWRWRLIEPIMRFVDDAYQHGLHQQSR